MDMPLAVRSIASPKACANPLGRLRRAEQAGV